MLKEIQNYLNKKNPTIVQVDLKRPDGLYESASFHLPEETCKFINFMNTFSKMDGYTPILSTTSISEMVLNIRRKACCA